MSNPYKLEGPAVIHFSGGRTSAYMLRMILDAHGGTLPDDVVVSFQNTGKERLETLDFIHEIETRWGVSIVWLEYCLDDAGEHSFRVVDYASADRDGRPFAELIKKKAFLPNPVTRFCTSWLKVETVKRYLCGLGWEYGWSSALGIRYDEPRRWSRIKGKKSHDEPVMPLVSARVGLEDIDAFWSSQPFKLELMPHEGNCDLCFLKGAGKIQEIIERRPDLAEWWAAQEARELGKSGISGLFRSDRPRYQAILDGSKRQLRMFDADEPSISCFCGD